MRILIPAYNPSEKIYDLVDNIKEKINIPIIVIDDGSREEFKSIFKKLEEKDITILFHEINQGKGQAIKTGIEYLKKVGEKEGCICADADGQHAPEDILRVLDKLKNSNKDLILGARDFSSDITPFRSKFGNNISKVLFYAMTGEKISDTQTGLRGYSARIFDFLLGIKGDRYEYEFNVLLNLKENNITYDEIKIKTIYEEGNKESHFRPIQDSILIYKPVFKFLMSSLSSFVIDFILLLVFNKAFGKLFIAVVLSRAISSLFNFFVNKKYVFEYKEENKLFKAAFKYYSLVIIIMLLNYLGLKLFTEILGMNLVIAKIIIEIFLYSLSFIAQKRIVFAKEIKK